MKRKLKKNKVIYLFYSVIIGIIGYTCYLIMYALGLAPTINIDISSYIISFAFGVAGASIVCISFGLTFRKWVKNYVMKVTTPELEIYREIPYDVEPLIPGDLEDKKALELVNVDEGYHITCTECGKSFIALPLNTWKSRGQFYGSFVCPYCNYTNKRKLPSRVTKTHT